MSWEKPTRLRIAFQKIFATTAVMPHITLRIVDLKINNKMITLKIMQIINTNHTEATHIVEHTEDHSLLPPETTQTVHTTLEEDV